MMKFLNPLSFAVFAVFFLMPSCKKDKVEKEKEEEETPFMYSVETVPTPASSDLEKLADSAYLFTREIYLWNDDATAKGTSLLKTMYAGFNPRQYVGGNGVETAENVMWATRGFFKNDVFSMALSRQESDGISTGVTEDYGFFVKAAYDLSNNINWYVTYVYDQSDAGQKGVKRGWIINKINDVPIAYNQASVDALNDLFFGTGTSANVEFTKSDGAVETITLNKTTFQANSVLYYNVISSATSGGKKVGYLVFNEFLGQPSRDELKVVFNYFQAQGIQELVVDLRNNLGGSTDTQDTLANLIAPVAANGKKMYQYEFNKILQEGKFSILKKKYNYSTNAFKLNNNTIPFEKAGTLNLSRVFFIVSYNSASASELLINNLKPVMDVQLIGDTTRGKPVGFFPIYLYNNKVAIYPVSFRTINSAGNADYYKGFAPNILANDGVNLDWGNPNDPCLSQALNYINTGRYMTAEKSFMASAGKTQARSVSGTEYKKMGIEQLERKRPGMYIER
ncbi:MAG: S41 family peptidase [Niabella sp.]